MEKVLENCFASEMALRVFFQIIFHLDPHKYFSLREFAFILKDDVHLRYLSFSNTAEFMEKLQRSSPHKIDIGAVYNRPVCGINFN